MRTLEPWVAPPLETFLTESSARLVLLMTSAGQVVAQHGFTRSLDVMAAAALGAGIIASTSEVARIMGRRHGAVRMLLARARELLAERLGTFSRYL